MISVNVSIARLIIVRTLHEVSFALFTIWVAWAS
jgi:hypothetical protein